MDTRLVSKIRQAGISSITASKEYRKALTELAKSIREQCSTAPNEATISSNFDFQIHDFLKAVFDIEYTPTKEQSVDRLLHVSKGRIDSKWGGVIIEYKDRDKLSTQTLQESAISQVCDFINGLNAVDNIITKTKCVDIRNEMCQNRSKRNASNIPHSHKIKDRPNAS